MKLLIKKIIFIVFWGLVIIDIAGIYFNNQAIHFFVKPLLMPALILATLSLSVKTAGRKKIVGALFFSFLGDVFLLFQDKYPICFILGLCYFLITHIFYISYFYQLNRSFTAGFKKNTLISLLIILYTISLLFLLIPGLGSLMIPVIVYACIISFMVYFSFAVPLNKQNNSRNLFITGAICFVISDSMLAMDKFYQTFYLAPVLIMFTYCMAQFLLVKGFIKNNH